MDLVVTVPSAVVGDPSSRIRVYLRSRTRPRPRSRRRPLAATAQTVIPVELTKGINDFSVTIVGPGRRVRPVADGPLRPRPGAGQDHDLLAGGRRPWSTGRPSRSTARPRHGRTLIAHNAANGTSVSGDGGDRRLVHAQPADLDRVQRDHDHRHRPRRQRQGAAADGPPRLRDVLTAVLGSSAYRLSVAELPQDVTLTAAASDPDGNPRGRRGHHVHVEHPGHPHGDRRTSDRRAGSRGIHHAVPVGADPGQGSATILLYERGVRLGPGLHGHHDRAGAGPGSRSRRGSTARPVAATINHAVVAMSALRDTPGRDSAMLGLPPIEHRLRRLPAFPTRRSPRQLGYCGLDRLRRPLTGDEIRPCWEAADATGAASRRLPGVGPVWPLESGDRRTTVRPLDFVEVPLGSRSAPSPSTPGDPSRADSILFGAPPPAANRAGACGATRGLSRRRRPRGSVRSEGRVPSVTWRVISLAVTQDLQADRLAR